MKNQNKEGDSFCTPNVWIKLNSTACFVFHCIQTIRLEFLNY